MKSIHSIIASFLLLSAVPALAHHSAAGVDTTKTYSADATLKQFAWSAPHAQIVVTYQDENGKDIELSVLTFAPAMLINQGFSPKDFRRGDKIKLFWHPNRNGSPGGILSKIISADGRVMSGEAGGAPGAPATPYAPSSPPQP